jgi:hypothetical protein
MGGFMNEGLNIAWYNLLGGSRQDGGLSLENLLALWCPRDDEFHPEVELQEGDAMFGDNENGTPGCMQVSRYLQQVAPLRLARLRPLLGAPRADAINNGMAVLVADGVPGLENEVEAAVVAPPSPQVGDADAADTRRGIVVQAT